MRMNLVGPEVTQRLENLDKQRSEWKDKDVQSWQALYKFCADKRWQCGVSSA